MHTLLRVIGVLPDRLLSVVLALGFGRAGVGQDGASAWQCCTNAAHTGGDVLQIREGAGGGADYRENGEVGGAGPSRSRRTPTR
jgi:hypothetical protein